MSGLWQIGGSGEPRSYDYTYNQSEINATLTAFGCGNSTSGVPITPTPLTDAVISLIRSKNESITCEETDYVISDIFYQKFCLNATGCLVEDWDNFTEIATQSVLVKKVTKVSGFTTLGLISSPGTEFRDSTSTSDDTGFSYDPFYFDGNIATWRSFCGITVEGRISSLSVLKTMLGILAGVESASTFDSLRFSVPDFPVADVKALVDTDSKWAFSDQGLRSELFGPTTRVEVEICGDVFTSHIQISSHSRLKLAPKCDKVGISGSVVWMTDPSPGFNPYTVRDVDRAYFKSDKFVPTSLKAGQYLFYTDTVMRSKRKSGTSINWNESDQVDVTKEMSFTTEGPASDDVPTACEFVTAQGHTPEEVNITCTEDHFGGACAHLYYSWRGDTWQRLTKLQLYAPEARLARNTTVFDLGNRALLLINPVFRMQPYISMTAVIRYTGEFECPDLLNYRNLVKLVSPEPLTLPKDCPMPAECITRVAFDFSECPNLSGALPGWMLDNRCIRSVDVSGTRISTVSPPGDEILHQASTFARMTINLRGTEISAPLDSRLCLPDAYAWEIGSRYNPCSTRSDYLWSLLFFLGIGFFLIGALLVIQRPRVSSKKNVYEY